MIKLVLDERHVFVYRDGSYRLRVYQDMGGERPDVVLVSDCHLNASETISTPDALREDLEAKFDWIRFEGHDDDDDHAILVTYSPNCMVWTPNGHVRCEMWNQYQFLHGTARTGLSRQDVVELTGHEIGIDLSSNTREETPSCHES
jgi:hypothetical protein